MVFVLPQIYHICREYHETVGWHLKIWRSLRIAWTQLVGLHIKSREAARYVCGRNPTTGGWWSRGLADNRKINQWRVEYCCGGVLPLLNFYATLLARGWPIGWLILLFQEDRRCFKWQSAAAKAKALVRVRASNNLRVRIYFRTLFFTLWLSLFTQELRL